MDRDFAIGERQFKLSKINAMLQFHIARRVGPILADLIPLMKEIDRLEKAGKLGKDLSVDEQFEQIAAFVGPVMNGISKLPDAEAEKVLFGLLTAVEVHQPQFNSWAKVTDGTRLMIQDLDLATLIHAAGRAFVFNLAGFFSALPRK